MKCGGLIEVPFGVSLREIIDAWGEGTRSGRPVKAVQVGGPLGAYLSADQLDVPLTYEALSAIGGMLGHGGIVVFDDTVDMAKQAHFAMDFGQKNPAVSARRVGLAPFEVAKYSIAFALTLRQATI